MYNFAPPDMELGSPSRCSSTRLHIRSRAGVSCSFCRIPAGNTPRASSLALASAFSFSSPFLPRVITSLADSVHTDNFYAVFSAITPTERMPGGGCAPHTAHTCNPVPFVLAERKARTRRRRH
ncbi:hypothetical protein B0H19DRAFT_1111357 [Mycena capillaripes]|nr:hypothetical protein B0H19DRAFT_1111357 [Mycena capillaripes]